MAYCKTIRNILPLSIYLFLHKSLGKIFYHKQIKSRVDKFTVLLADYPRCGIGWLRFVIATVLHYYHTGGFRKLSSSEMYTYVPTLAGREIYKPFYFNGRYSLLKTHYKYIPDFRQAIIIYRNPFDAIRSYYTHKLMEEGDIVCKNFAGFTKEESFLIVQIQEYIDYYEGWLRPLILYPDCYLMIKYEDLLKKTKELFKKIFEFLKIDILCLSSERFDKLVKMYNRTDVSIPLERKKEPNEAFRIKFDIFRQIQPRMTKDTLYRFNPNLVRRLDDFMQKIDSLRYKV
jgi:hypothetical protein